MAQVKADQPSVVVTELSERTMSIHNNGQNTSATGMADVELGRTSPDSPGQTSEPSDLDISQFESIPNHRRVYIEINHLSAHVPSLFGQPSMWQRFQPSAIKRRVTEGGSLRTPKMNQILYDVSGCVNPGEVLALMGPSGSGKTTLLSIMGGRAQRSMQVQGQVLFNGGRLDKKMKRNIGFVMQDDLLYESLTVYETLYYAAMLRLPKEMSREAKIHRVNTVIRVLGLEKCKDTIVGGFFRRGISGGERKRASVGHELLINPSTLFLDEPTSGLDSTTAMHLLETLRALAQGGRAVVTTIHQPSSRLYQQLDKLLLLSQGHALYYGHAQAAVDFFERLGYTIPPRVNAADFILDLASGEVPGWVGDGEASRVALISMSETLLVARPLDGFDPEDEDVTAALEDIRHVYEKEKDDPTAKKALSSRLTSQLSRVHSSRQFAEDEAGMGHLANVPEGAAGFGGSFTGGQHRPYLGQHNKTLPRGVSKYGGWSVDEAGNVAPEGNGDRWGAPYWAQVGYLFQRNLRTRRFQSLSVQDMLQFLAIAVLSGLFWLQQGQGVTLADSRNVLGVLFFMAMFLSFRSLFVSLFTFPEEQRHMLKERASGMYRLSAFYVARMLADFPTDLSIPTGFIIIVYFMAGLRYDAGAFFGIYGTLLLTMLVAQSIGLLLGTIFMNPKTAQTVATVLMLTVVLTGGFFVLDIPPWIGWLKWLSFIYYSLGILLFIQYDGGNTVVYSCSELTTQGQCIQTSPSNPQTNPSCVPVQSLQDSLSLLQNPSSEGDTIRDGFVLLGFLVVLRIAVYYVLRRKTAGL